MKMALRGRPQSINKPGDIEMHFGHQFIVGDDGVAVAKIDKELAEIELAAGRLEKFVEQTITVRPVRNIKKADEQITAKDNDVPQVKA